MNWIKFKNARYDELVEKVKYYKLLVEAEKLVGADDKGIAAITTRNLSYRS